MKRDPCPQSSQLHTVMTKQRNPEGARPVFPKEAAFGCCLSAFAKLRRRVGLCVASPCQSGKWRQEVVTFLIEQIKTAGSRACMVDVPSVPPGPSDAERGRDRGRPRDLGLLCPQTLLFGWSCTCCGGKAVL